MDFEAVVYRVRAEFVEMPGLRLTPAQATRLWGLDCEACHAVINALIDYEPDRSQWGVADQWTAPFLNKKGAFETGHGDCEDYALAKYVALRQAGVRSEDVRVALVHDNAVRVDHAILVVRMTSAGWSSIIGGINWSRIRNSHNSSRLPSSTPAA